MGNLHTKKWILFFSFLLLAACGPSKEDATLAKEIEDVNNLRQTYAQFVGLYRGRVTPLAGGAETMPVELQIRIVEVPDGVNDNREVRYRPEMRGYFQRLDIDPGNAPTVRRPIQIGYRRELNQLMMSNTDTPNLPVPGAGFVSISATYNNGRIFGEIRYNLDGIGQLDVERIY